MRCSRATMRSSGASFCSPHSSSHRSASWSTCCTSRSTRVSGGPEALRRFAQDRTAVVAAIILAVLVVGALVGPLLLTTDPTQQLLSQRRSPPDRDHLL